MSLVFLPKDCASSLKCSECGSYLSVGPITITESNWYCGRCDSGFLEAKEFEIVAKFMVFPCINDVFGCQNSFRWNTAQHHEETCEFAPISCPLSPCRHKLSTEDFQKHVAEYHQDHLLNKPILTITKTSPVSVNIFDTLGTVFIVMTSFLKDNWVFQMYTTDKVETKLCVELLQLNNTNPGVNKYLGDYVIECYKYSKKIAGISICKRANFDSMFRNNNPMTLSFKIVDPSEKNNDQMLSDIECPVCFELMRPPIYMCSNRHSICSKCLTQVEVCPLCRVVITKTKNHHLQQISANVIYPCVNENKGCRFRAKLREIRTHEKVCGIIRLRPSRTNIKEQNCKKKIVLGATMKHKLTRVGIETFEATYNNESFSIQIYVTKTKGLQILIKALKTSSDQYSYTIRLKKDDCEICMSRDCKTKQNKDLFTGGLTLSMLALEPFVVCDVITFTINILLKNRDM